jgi:hypothetical protein
MKTKTQYNFRRSNFTDFWNDPAKFVQKFLHPENFKPSEAMQFGTDQHAIREKQNGKNGEVYIEVPMGGHLIHGTIDYYDKKEVCDYKYSQKIDTYKLYVSQIAFYQFLVWKKDNLLVPGRLEFIEVFYNPFATPEFTLSGITKNYNFKAPCKTDLIKFETKVLSAMKQMIYLIEKSKLPKPKQPKLKHTKEDLIESSSFLPESMRTKNTIRSKSVK